ncbi:FtsX-like permease family protein [Duganella sp. CT11-25]|uniref:FtsX-like permease family protein n=1 Tax=unclassified Duganella TaxID=2636909 RepID=UPI0039AF6FC9
MGWRQLRKQGAYSAVVILGLSVAIAIVFLLLGFVRFSFSYDAHVPQAGQVYLVNTKLNFSEASQNWTQESPLAIVAQLRQSGVAVQASAYLQQTRSVVVGSQVQELDLHLVDPAFVDVFGVKAQQGDLRATLGRPDALAVTADTARQLFADQPPLGQVVRIAGRAYTVGALLPNPPATTTVPYRILAGVQGTILAPEKRADLLSNWAALDGRVYLRLGETLGAAGVTRQLQDAADRSPLRNSVPPEVLTQLGERKLLETRLIPLRDAYFRDDVQFDVSERTHGDLRAMLGLCAVAAVILALAVFNFVSLSTVRTLRRQREIAVRKVLGAPMVRIVGLFLAESVMTALGAAVLGLLLAWALQHPFASLVNRTALQLFDVAGVLACLLGSVLLGLAAGAYPAWVALNVRPTQALAGRDNAETASGQWLRRALTIVQFGAAMCLSGCCIAIAWQTYYMARSSPGFDPAPLLQVELVPSTNLGSEVNRSFRDAVARLPGVTEVAAAHEIVGRHRVKQLEHIRRPGGAAVSMTLKGVSGEFFAAYDVGALAGRVFSAKLDQPGTDAVVVNARAAAALGFDSAQAAVGQYVQDGDGGNLRVVGVAGEMRHTSLRETGEPVLYFLAQATRVLTVRTEGGRAPVAEAIEALWKRHFPQDVLHLSTGEAAYALDAEDDARIAAMLAVSTVVASLIAGFGIYVLAAYAVQRRKREITVRKLFGARSWQIAALLGKEFTLIVAVAAAVGLPLAAVIIHRYLLDFVERAPIGGWPLLAALAASCLVAAAATSRHTLAAIRMRPSLSLRD